MLVLLAKDYSHRDFIVFFALTSDCSTRITLRSLIIFVLVSFTANSPPLLAQPTIEDYGNLPFIRSMSMSPDSKHFAWLQESDGMQGMVVYNIEDGQPFGVGANDKIKARDVEFVSDDFAIMHVSDTRVQFGYSNSFEYSAAFSFDLKTRKTRHLLRGTEDLHPAQSGLGTIVGVNSKKSIAYMPAFNDSSTPQRNLYRVSLKGGKGKLHASGRSHTIDWFVNSKGEVLAREDFDDKREKHEFYSYLSGKPEKVFSYDTKLPQMSVQAVSWDEKHLLFVQKNDDGETVHALSLQDGQISPAMFYREDKSIDRLLTDTNRRLIAVKYSGFLPSYEFEKPKLQTAFDELLSIFPASAVHLLTMSADENTFLVRITGNTDPNSFFTFDIKKKQLKRLTNGYKNIEQKDLGEVVGFRYSARDGLKIPAILTWPVGVNTAEERKALPLIALPHGGPAAHDAIRFDWLAQFLAHKGYAVLQPNFRGSTGFGFAHEEAGKGRWGKEMQDDITDGVNYLVSKGVADPSRVCILGASYGGYAALAGAAYTPELYRCAIAINAVSDIRKEIKKDLRQAYQTDWIRNYWMDAFGSDDKKFKQLDAVSPYYFADQFTAPTLLIYSKDDTVVAPVQSIRMHKALKKAGKDSKLVALKGEDHWMSTSKMRLELLKTIEAYLDKHNPAP
ncbi:alpha/beta hydrolase family protein [Halioxenophilus aromaticivorans]|uniref:S9 family peptidase n=1 Tax=Halioxenophilus aromaticivorans TaxID=1306992 RepID=A0AAV3U2W3_9ALTE